MDMLKNSKWFVPYSYSPAAKLNLFCLHHAGGSAAFYSAWPKHLSAMVNVIAIQLPGRESRYGEPFANNIEQIVSELVKYSAVFAHKPYALFGHSLGALIGFSLAKELIRSQDITPQFFISSAHPAPRRSPLEDKLDGLPDDQFVQKMVDKYGGISEEVLNSKELLEFLMPRFRADIFLSEAHLSSALNPVPFSIVTLYGKNDKSVTLPGIQAWQHETQEQLQIHSFEGNHFFVETEEEKVLGIINKLVAKHLWALEV